MKFKHNHLNIIQSGFSLIELMIAMLIGLIATLVIVQTLSTFEGQKRGTTGTSDAQTNGNVGLFSIAKEVKQSGYGLMTTGQSGTADSPLDCTSVNYHTSGVTSIAPLDITDGATASGDTITIRYGTADLGGAISSLTAATTANSPTGVDSTLGCTSGDVVIVMDAANCHVSKLATTNGVNNGNAISSANVGTQTLTFIDSMGSAGNDFACLGTWNQVAFRVVSGNLQKNGVDIMPDIASLQAQYGVSASPTSNQINKWVNASSTADADGEAWNAPTPAQRKRIKAIRVAIIARNPHIESTGVTSACSSTTSASPTGLCAWGGIAAGTGNISTASPAPTIDLSSSDTNWARYHYSVFESIIPLRNTIWAKGTL
jgi:type IV pilus assembly protein PilW